MNKGKSTHQKDEHESYLDKIRKYESGLPNITKEDSEYPIAPNAVWKMNNKGYISKTVVADNGDKSDVIVGRNLYNKYEIEVVSIKEYEKKSNVHQIEDLYVRGWLANVFRWLEANDFELMQLKLSYINGNIIDINSYTYKYASLEIRHKTLDLSINIVRKVDRKGFGIETQTSENANVGIKPSWEFARSIIQIKNIIRQKIREFKKSSIDDEIDII